MCSAQPRIPVNTVYQNFLVRYVLVRERRSLKWFCYIICNFVANFLVSAASSVAGMSKYVSISSSASTSLNHFFLYSRTQFQLFKISKNTCLRILHSTMLEWLEINNDFDKLIGGYGSENIENQISVSVKKTYTFLQETLVHIFVKQLDFSGLSLRFCHFLK